MSYTSHLAPMYRAGIYTVCFQYNSSTIIIMLPQEYISSESYSVQLPWIAFLHIDVTSSGENYTSGGVVVQQCKLWCTL